MSAIAQSYQNLTATGTSTPYSCACPGPHGANYAALHTWMVVNNSASQATVRPEGSLVEEYDANGLAATAWASLGSGATNIAAGAVALITVVDQPLVRARINVSVLADNSVDVLYLGVLF